MYMQISGPIQFMKWCVTKMTKTLELQSCDEIRLVEAYPLQGIWKYLAVDNPNLPVLGG